MKPVQSMADNKSEYNYNDWFEALDDMKSQINKIDFALLIIFTNCLLLYTLLITIDSIKNNLKK